MGTLVVGAVVLGVVLLAVRSVYRSKKSGGCAGCGGNCGCHSDGKQNCCCDVWIDSPEHR